MTKFKDKRVDKVLEYLEERAATDESLTNEELVTVQVLGRYLPAMYETLSDWAPGEDDDVDERSRDVLLGTYMAFAEIAAIMQVTMAGRSWDEQQHHKCVEVVVDLFKKRAKDNLSVALERYQDLEPAIGMVGGNDTMH